ncbi:hypothetical protein [Streptomyces sp. CAI-85]|uniref:hypothetical protein n=1 Tax=Streptomyces sp. CAI-85 TaxID=1472662 RepID=UPI0015877D69|nr:hypothetical protein [Streptomyces sp. CAI-85]NUV64013.1 hypothetical protein [Streptomyces sp. CAI-85]
MRLRAAASLTAAVATVAVLAGTTTQVSAAESVPANAFASPTAYADYLKHSNEEGALETLKGFEALSPNKQSQFLRYVQDPALYKDFIVSSADEQNSVTALTADTNRTVSLRDGDVTFESNSVVSGLTASASGVLPAGIHEVKRYNTIKALGVPVAQLSIWVKFQSNGRDITKVIDADGAAKRWGPISIKKEKAKTSLGTQQFCERGGRCVGGHTAIASIIWNFDGTTASYDKKQVLKVGRNGTGSTSLQNP